MQDASRAGRCQVSALKRKTSARSEYLTDTVEKVSKIDLWNWIVKQSNPSKWIFESMLLVRRSP